MSTFTFRITSSATNPGGLTFGQQPDVGAPSYMDMIVTNSTDPLIVNGTYDAYCLNPSASISVKGVTYQADQLPGDVLSSYQTIGLTNLTQAKVDQLSWLLAQNFTSDAKYGGQFNYGEVQMAIWEIVGFTAAQIATYHADPRYLNDNNRNVIDPADITFLKAAAATAIGSGNGGEPTDTFFSAVIDPAGNIQPLIVQLQNAKLGNFVWLDTNANGIQESGEAGVDHVIVQLYDNNGNLISSTTTGDDYSTAQVESGYYQFTGLKAGDYQVKFLAPADMVLTTTDAGSNANDATDSDASQVTGLSHVVTLSAGESDQTIDAGIYKLASLGDYVWVDGNNDGQQNDGATSGLNGVTVNLYKGDGSFVATAVTANDTNGNSGYYAFTNLVPGDYKVEFIKPAGYAFASQDQGADGSDSDANINTGMTVVTTLVSGENDLSWDAGLVQLASLGDYVWVDGNNDGQQNDGATSGLNGVTVNLYKGDGSFVATAVTADDTNGNAGYYHFVNLLAGDYKVEFIKPAGYIFAQQNVGADNTDSDADTASGMAAVTTLVPGENDLSWDAGLVKLASLGDYVWVDGNNDGQQNDGASSGVNGVTVNLYKGDGTFVATAVTGNDTGGNAGYYNFVDLIPGDYKVEFIKPAGYIFAKQDIGADGSDSDANTTTGMTAVTTLTSGENDLTLDAGLLQLASLGDYVWLDTNNDGQQNDGAASGVNGVTVNLYKGDGSFVATAVTGNDTGGNAGYYNFVDLIPGDYKVEFVKPVGYVFAKQDIGADGSDSDANTSTGMTAVTTLSSGENDLTLDAGLLHLASLGDYVWVDGNNDGQQNDGAASGLNGVTVNLYKGDGTFVATTTTANDTGGNSGYYNFIELIPGDYKVEFVKPTGYAFAKQDIGADGSDSDANTTTGLTAVTTLTAGENDLTLDAGLVQLASLGDYVWEDINNDGQQNDGATSGVNGVTVKLYKGDGTFVSSTTTANDGTGKAGFYKFADLLPGDYKVEFVKPTGYAFAKQDIGADGSDSDANTTTGVTAVTTLVSGENDLTWDAGLVKLASLGDYVWEDCNNDGQQNDGSTSGVNGVTVKLYKADGTFVSSTTTANDGTGKAGYYKFINLNPGDYKVEFVKPTGYTFAKQDVGADGSDSDANTTTGMTTVTTLTSGENDLTWDAGLIKLASLGDYVWEDCNNDGQQNDGSSSGMNGVTVKLYKADGTFVATTTTANDSNGKAGFYKFSNLNPGDYKVEFVKPAGYAFAKQDLGSNSTDSDANTSTGMTAITTLSSGENDLSWDAGLVKVKASIGDFVWEDSNMNGVQDSGEKGIANVTVKLLNSAGTVVDTTTTNSTGKYLFDELNPGDYKIQVVKPSGFYITKQNQGSNDGLDSDISTSTGTTALTTLTAGENDLSWDAGLYRKASVGDKVWDDMDHDNVQDLNEPGIGGITVKLMTTAGVVLETTKTNSKGNYLFDELDPGTYVLQFEKGGVQYYQYNTWNNMSNWKWAVKNAGSNDSIDSDVAGNAISTTNITKTDAFTLVSGQNDMTRDAGITPLVIDLNGDGIQTVSRADAGGTFDLFGNGTAVASGWISEEDGFLAVDSNSNGSIDDISELFGGLNKGDGFARLSSFDSNSDGLVNANDANFGSLLIWQDSNGNHQTDDG
ncbi:MAG: SdrD B-like domain-containing protein, partial [Pseudomonadota bacterium]